MINSFWGKKKDYVKILRYYEWGKQAKYQYECSRLTKNKTKNREKIKEYALASLKNCNIQWKLIQDENCKVLKAWQCQSATDSKCRTQRRVVRRRFFIFLPLLICCKPKIQKATWRQSAYGTSGEGCARKQWGAQVSQETQVKWSLSPYSNKVKTHKETRQKIFRVFF